MVTPRSRSGRSRRCRHLLSLFYLDWSSPRCADDCASAAATAGRDVAIGGAAAKSPLGLAAAAFVASLSSFQFGYATGILNVPQRIITTDLGLDKDSISWAVVVSIWALGGLLGAQVAAVVADSRGRRPLLALSGLTCGTSGLVAFCAGTASLAAGPESVGGRSALCLLVLSRFISGGGCGMATVAAPGAFDVYAVKLPSAGCVPPCPRCGASAGHAAPPSAPPRLYRLASRFADGGRFPSSKRCARALRAAAVREGGSSAAFCARAGASCSSLS